jgi:predicted transcriptional regulator
MLSAYVRSVKNIVASELLWKNMWNVLWYVINMAKKKTRIIQVPMPEDLVAKLDAISYEIDESRSFVIREAAARYVTAREEAELDRQYAAAYAKDPEDAEEMKAMEAASAESLKDDPW